MKTRQFQLIEDLVKAMMEMQLPEIKEVDNGIGAYEYWGAKGVDRNVQWVSTCCDATLLENTPSKPEASPPEPNYGERDYYD